MTTLTPTDIKTLEQTRQRLSQLTNSLASLQQSLLQSDPLPSWTSLTSLTTILAHSLTSLSTHLTSNHALLSSLTVYPLPSFPGRTHEAVLLQLLRKKLEPGVEDWVDEGRALGEEVLGSGRGDGEEGGFLGREGEGDAGVEEERKKEIEEVWMWAGMAANKEARRYEWGGGDGTLEEREGGGVEGGKEEDGEEEEEEEGGEGKEEAMPMPMEDVLRFLVKGDVGG